MNKKWIVVAIAAFAIALAGGGCKVVFESNPVAESKPVAAGSVAVESVTLNKPTLALAPDKTEKLMATIKPDNADNKTVQWSSSNTEIATVDNNGTVKAVKVGTATITVQAGGKEAKCEITVKENLVAVESVKLNKSTLALTLGETEKLTATISPDNADNKTVQWSSSNTEIATVDNNGTVKAVKVGTATITAWAGGKSATCLVTVSSQSGGEDDNDFVIEGGVLIKYNGSKSTVTIPAGVTQIGNEAFKGCTSLTTVNIPTGVTSIGDSAFKGCAKLTTVNIPASMTNIVLYAFDECSNIKTVNYGGTLAQWCSIQNDSRLTMNANSVMLGDGNDLKTLTKLEIPEGVQHIGDFTFVECKHLTNVTIKGNVKTIGWCAFSGCTALESIVIPDSVTCIKEQAFLGCMTLESVVIPDSVTDIEICAFSNCEGLKTVTIPAGVKTIEYGAFAGCSNLTEVTISNGVETIGECAFFGCNKLTEITIPNGVKSIGDSAFQKCLKLAKVSIPASVNSVGRFTFSEVSTNLVVNYSGTKSQWDAIKGIDIILVAKGTTIKCNDTTWSVN